MNPLHDLQTIAALAREAQFRQHNATRTAALLSIAPADPGTPPREVELTPAAGADWFAGVLARRLRLRVEAGQVSVRGLPGEGAATCRVTVYGVHVDHGSQQLFVEHRTLDECVVARDA